MALINLQLKHYLKNLFPNFKQPLYKDSSSTQIFNCYGIYLEPPQLEYFPGGFVLSGNYQNVPQNNDMCLDMSSTNPLDVFIDQFVPNELKNDFKKISLVSKVIDGADIDVNDLMPLIQSKEFEKVLNIGEKFLDQSQYFVPENQ